MQDSQELERLYRLHFRTVWNICLTFLKNPSDTEDAVQETFLRLLRECTQFESEEHSKAWLIHTAKNVCRDELRRHRRMDLPLDEARNASSKEIYIDETLEAVRALPEQYRAAIYLFYYTVKNMTKIAGPMIFVGKWNRGCTLGMNVSVST
ncbi:MAG: sigma-70 family RNA polymerase sigma factor [Oscillospiraceae bacterium]|nr:sigma-70 family RNA polymerase sigma factor [Oscillospiraceae bacterium]